MPRAFAQDGRVHLTVGELRSLDSAAALGELRSSGSLEDVRISTPLVVDALGKCVIDNCCFEDSLLIAGSRVSALELHNVCVHGPLKAGPRLTSLKEAKLHRVGLDNGLLMEDVQVVGVLSLRTVRVFGGAFVLDDVSAGELALESVIDECGSRTGGVQSGVFLATGIHSVGPAAIREVAWKQVELRGVFERGL